jgi:hypothetical protein
MWLGRDQFPLAALQVAEGRDCPLHLAAIIEVPGTMQTLEGRPSIARYVWASPTTALGLLVVLAGCWRAQLRIVDGVLEAHGPGLAWLLSHLTVIGGVTAITLGHVVVARDGHSLELTRAHERVHVRQCEQWGPLFVPAYLAASLIAFARGRHFYFDNRFEIEAFDDSPGESS